jgi:hypothetical protein
VFILTTILLLAWLNFLYSKPPVALLKHVNTENGVSNDEEFSKEFLKMFNEAKNITPPHDRPYKIAFVGN